MCENEKAAQAHSVQVSLFSDEEPMAQERKALVSFWQPQDI
jgi:hypothetical protein